tara:strand:+ start:720 stop:992 length:273 start_codon:yes stop_codon:yes gene_type:complete
MIFQRLATSIREQDWFTVAVETLIVVFGVFIGLQVNNWNAASQDRAQLWHRGTDRPRARRARRNREGPRIILRRISRRRFRTRMNFQIGG